MLPSSFFLQDPSTSVVTEVCVLSLLQFNRDRFVLSNGHACALLYSMLHLTGYDLPMSELKRFRQVDAM